MQASADLNSERQLKRKIKDWKLEKKVKGDEMKVIVQKMQQRVGKNTTFRVRGQTVEPAKIQRWQKRTETLDTPTMPTPLPESRKFCANIVIPHDLI
jgi:hypothetical protein